MVSYAFRMPAGIPGDINRSWAAIVEPQVITASGQANAPVSYGVGVLIDATTSKVRLPTTGDTVIYGVLVRPYPTQNSQDPLGVSTPPASGECDVLKRGYITVLLQNTTAAKKAAAVYCRIVAAAGLVVGGFEAVSDPGNNILVSGAYFTGAADASGNVEIAFGI